jgi:hypothetical protein
LVAKTGNRMLKHISVDRNPDLAARRIWDRRAINEWGLSVVCELVFPNTFILGFIVLVQGKTNRIEHL